MGAMKERAEIEAIEVFATNLKDLLITFIVWQPLMRLDNQSNTLRIRLSLISEWFNPTKTR